VLVQQAKKRLVREKHKLKGVSLLNFLDCGVVNLRKRKMSAPRSRNRAPVNLLSVNLLGTYKSINEVSFRSRCATGTKARSLFSAQQAPSVKRCVAYTLDVLAACSHVRVRLALDR
jgi:hypothetical protein